MMTLNGSVLEFVEHHNIHTVLVDASGVLYNDKGAFPGVVGAISALQVRGVQVFLATNNTSSSVPIIQQFLERMGIFFREDHILSSGLILDYVPKYREMVDGKRVYVVGSESSNYYVQRAGGIISERLSEVDTIVFASSFQNDNDAWLDDVCDFAKVNPETNFLSVNPDFYVQHSYGQYSVIGHYVDIFKERTGMDVLMCGKPYPSFSQLIENRMVAFGCKLGPQVAFFDDNPFNVMQLVEDLGVTGVRIEETGLQFEGMALPVGLHRMGSFK